MKKPAVAVAALLAAALLANTTGTAGAATTASNSGLCNSGAAWTINGTRSGDKVSVTLNVSPLPARSLWNVNTAWTPINTVGNATVKADGRGRLTFKTQATSKAKVTVYVWLDWQSTVFNCVAVVTL
jgi:hypothetical protein